MQLQAQNDAGRELAELSPRIPKLVVTVDGAAQDDVAVSLDGKAIPSALLGEEQLANPGAHSVTGVRGAERVEEAVTLVEAQNARLVLHFHQPAASAVGQTPSPVPAATTPLVGALRVDNVPSSARDVKPSGGNGHTLAFVALAVGGAGLLTGGITGIVALGQHSDLNSNPACKEGKCLSSVQASVDSFHTMRTVSSIGFIAGGAFAATGLVLLFTGGHSETKADRQATPLALRLDPGGASVMGAF